MRRIAALLVPLLCLTAQPVAAQAAGYAEMVEEEVVWLDAGSDRVLTMPPAAVSQGIAAYGPFRVLDSGHAALVDVTDARTPAEFAAMLQAFPHIAEIAMVDCPGTDDDLAANPNLVKSKNVRPPSGTGRIRLVCIGADGAVDSQPCGGTHVSTTSEVGEIHIGKIEKKGRENRRFRIRFGPVPAN